MDDVRVRALWPERLAEQTGLRDRLVAAYAAPGRAYHDVRHLVEVLDQVGVLLAQPTAGAVDRDTVVLAAWFHDAVYDGAPTDEQNSAALAEETLATAAIPDRVVAEVARLVRLTRDHDPTPDDVAGQVLSDADLAILAADAERYAEYVRGVRCEYSRLDDATFAEGRAAVIRALLSRPELFRTPLGRERWEERARANLAREITELVG